MKKSGFIDSIRVTEPCTQDWNKMTGNDQVRFCDHCAKNVNNISEMTRKSARKLVLASEGNLCVRYVKHPATGGPIFASQLVKIAARSGITAGIIGASIAAAQPAFAQGSPETAEIVRVTELSQGDGTKAKLNGTVYDPQGAVIPFAVISVTNKETGDYRAINADSDGAYEFLDLPPARYSMKIEAVGFQNFVLDDLALTDGSRLRKNAELKLPLLTEVVQIGGDEEVYYTVDGGISISLPINPLVGAVLAEDLEQVKVRVAMRERVNARDKSYAGMSPLHAAVETGNIEIARFLLEHGAKVNIRDHEKRTPMMMLDEDATPEIVQLLINYGAKAKLLDKEKNGALHHLALNGVDPEIVRLLVNYGYNANGANKEGKTPLMLAAENEEEEILSALLQTGADANIKMRDGRSAIDLAANEAVRATLRTYGAIAKQ